MTEARWYVAACAAVVALATVAQASEVHPLARAAAREGVPVERAQAVVEALTEAGAGEWTPMLLAIAMRESSLRVSVEACDTTGDNGHAVGLWQTHARGMRRDQLCRGGMRAQARYAVHHMLRVCGGSPEARVACYAGRKPDHWIVRDRMALAGKLAAER